MADRIPVVKRVSLAGLGEGWDDQCYAYVRPADYTDLQHIEGANASSMKPADQVAFQREFVEKHWLSGKIMLFNGSDFELGDMTVDDCGATPAICDTLYMAIVGVELDPKELRDFKMAAVQDAQRPDDSTTTETPSSETSPQDSPTTSPEN